MPSLTNLTEQEKNNPINQEEIEAEKQYAMIEEYIDGKRTRKREEKAEEKKVQKIQETLNQVDFKR